MNQIMQNKSKIFLFQDPERASQLGTEFPGFYTAPQRPEASRHLTNGDILPGIMTGTDNCNVFCNFRLIPTTLECLDNTPCIVF